MISTHELEPGEIYVGRSGEMREIVTLDTHLVQYRLHTRRKSPPVDLRRMSRNKFCEWAQEAVI